MVSIPTPPGTARRLSNAHAWRFPTSCCSTWTCLPVFDGPGVLGVWRDDPNLRHIAVVLMSASARMFEVARQFDVRETMAKPLDLEALAACLERALSARDKSGSALPSIPAALDRRLGANS